MLQDGNETRYHDSLMRKSIEKLVLDQNNLEALRFIFKKRRMLGHSKSRAFGFNPDKLGSRSKILLENSTESIVEIPEANIN